MHEGLMFPCDQCKYEANCASNLNRHKKKVHEGVRYPCDKCDYLATQVSHLKNHKIKQHTVTSVICEPELDLVKYGPEPVLVKCEPETVLVNCEPRIDDDGLVHIKTEVLEEDPLNAF